MSAYYIAETGMLFTDREWITINLTMVRSYYIHTVPLYGVRALLSSYLNSQVQYVVADLVPLRDGRRLTLSTSSL